MAKIVEVKVRVKNDGLSWDNRQSVATFIVEQVEPTPGNKEWFHPMSGKTLVEKAKAVGQSYVGAEEIRWNWKGSPQGHYHFLTDDNGNNGGNNEQG